MSGAVRDFGVFWVWLPGHCTMLYTEYQHETLHIYSPYYSTSFPMHFMSDRWLLFMEYIFWSVDLSCFLPEKSTIRKWLYLFATMFRMIWKVLPCLILNLSQTQVINNGENAHFEQEHEKESNKNTSFHKNIGVKWIAIKSPWKWTTCV